MDGIVDNGILKYRSMIASISVAYAELAPEVNITLLFSLHHTESFKIASSPDKYSLLDTELPRIQLKAKQLRPSRDNSLVSQQMTEWIRHQYDEVRREGRCIRLEVEDLRG